MPRRLVLARTHELLRKASRNRKYFGKALLQLEADLRVPGMALDEKRRPVRHVTKRRLKRGSKSNARYRAPREETYCTVAHFRDEEAIARFRHDKADRARGDFADPKIRMVAVPGGSKVFGSESDVRKLLGFDALQKAKCTGHNVRVAVMDAGVDATKISVASRWSGAPAKSHWHGTMVAYDAKIMAPSARIFDYPILQNQATLRAFASDAVRAFTRLLELVRADDRPLVVVNSWGLTNLTGDDPIGAPGNYSANRNHPLNRVVADLVRAGADVLFAAGNCGTSTPYPGCGAQSGPAKSIHGAGSLPSVTCVGAVTYQDRRLSYSAQGPGFMEYLKPDLCAPSHFKGSGVKVSDQGTSAACPVAAGVVAALRTKFSRKAVSPFQMKALLLRTARNLGKAGWDAGSGYGRIDAARALAAAQSPGGGATTAQL